MKEILEKCIHWERLGKHPQEAYHYSLGRTRLDTGSGRLTQELQLNFIVPREDLLRMEQLLCDEIPGLAEVRFLCRYEDVILTPEETAKHFWPYLLEELREKNGAAAAAVGDGLTILKGREIETGDLLLKARSLGHAAMEGLKIEAAPYMAGRFKELFDLNVQVIFEEDEDAYFQLLSAQAEEEEKMQALAARQAEEAAKMESAASKEKSGGFGGEWAGRSGGSRRRKTDSGEDMVLGRRIKEEPIPIHAMRAEEGPAVVSGQIFFTESRLTKNGRGLLKFVFTDGTDSCCAKFYMEKDELPEMEKKLSKGKNVLVQGNVAYDPWEKEPVLTAQDIMYVPQKKRKDEAPVKRVEFHAHTKMSNMDGFIQAKDLVKLARSFGHKAVAVTDHGVVQSFPEAMSEAEAKGKDPIKVIYGMEAYLLDDDHMANVDAEYKNAPTYHMVILVKDQTGMRNLYDMVSKSHLNYFYKRPRLPRSLVKAEREGLIIGSACEAGELFRAILNGEPEERIREIASFYDYLEIQPLINNRFLVREGLVADEEGLRDLNRRIIALGKELDKPVIATCDAHYLEPEEALYRRILMAGQGYKDAEESSGLYFRTTEEMLEEFAYLGEEEAFRVVVEAPNALADTIDTVRPIAKGKFPPKIEGAEEKLYTKSWARARELYGDPLPEIVEQRLSRELSAIIDNGYAVMFMLAEMVVQKSLEDGYLVGSRGSVGSSLAATMAGITEVNPLPPHYICPKCRFSEFVTDGSYDCGADMPEKECPRCGAPLERLGFNIPFETFMGLEGNKEPDIDLNFASVYQSRAHKYIDEVFGKENVYKAGTISAVKEKTAYGFVKKYYEEKGVNVSKFELDRLAICCSGVRRTTGQHPGGLIIVPSDRSILEFCPVQHPANDTETDIVTTHFDYHSIDENLLKLDMLGHEVPTQLRMLQDMTGLKPQDIPMGDKRVMSLFNGIGELGIVRQDYPYKHGSFGIPEFGTHFVRGMLEDVKPEKFADLVRISGFSHGTDVWIGNIRDIIVSGTATATETVGCRDDIFTYLCSKGIDPKRSFAFMEAVRKNFLRKGKPWPEGIVEEMEEKGIPEWYIESCRKIQYLFPKAHAVAYTLMSYRMAYYKLYYPAAFYSAIFTTKLSNFNYPVIIRGFEAVQEKMREIREKGKEASQEEQDEMLVFELATEMYGRGLTLLPMDLKKSDAVWFREENGKIRPSFACLNGIGESAAEKLREETVKGPFFSIEELRDRTGLNRTAVEALQSIGALEGMAESNQLSFF